VRVAPLVKILVRYGELSYLNVCINLISLLHDH